MNNLDKFPTQKEIETIISKLENNDWPQFDPTTNVSDYIDRISTIFTTEFNILPDIIQCVEAKTLKFNLFRVRELSTFSNINLVCEHSYSPINLTTKLNRCNFPKYPVFYCSNNAMTALLEVVRNDNYQRRKYCISSWRINPTEDKVILQPYLFSDLHSDNHFKILRDSILERISKTFDDNLTEDQEKGLKLYLKFMAKIFINDNDYNMSAFFAHRRFYAPHNLITEILIYPSIQTFYKGVNMAIQPNFVDMMMNPKRFYIVEIKNIDQNRDNVNFSTISYGTVNGSKINWKDVTPEDLEYQAYFKEDFNYEGKYRFTENEP